VHLSLLGHVWLLIHPRVKMSVLVDRDQGHIYIAGILVYQVQGLFGCGLATTVFYQLTCLCAFVSAVAICPQSHWICSRGGVARLCSWWR